MSNQIAVHALVPDWVFATPTAALTTLLMFGLMNHLVTTTNPEVTTQDPLPIPNVVFQDSIIETYIDKRPVRPEELPSPPELPNNPLVSPNKLLPSPYVTKYTPRKNFVIGFNSGSQRPIASVQVAAKYPHRALLNNIEGFVDLQFNITEFGSTENIQVVHAEPKSIFDASAIKAVQKWRYQPIKKDGVPQGFNNMTTRVRFELGN